MKRKLLFLFAIPFCILLSCRPFVGSLPPTSTVPATQIQTIQPTATMPPAPGSTSTVVPTSNAPIVITDVTNTHWVGMIYDQDEPLIWSVFEIIFLPGGKLRYYTPNEWRENGTWNQEGDDITLEWGDHFCELYGVLYGDVIAGAKQCTGGKAWGWSVQYQAP
jgi:hypothetical protein